MAVTFTTNYKEIFPEDTVTIIEELKEWHRLEDILDVLDVFGDDWTQENLEAILNTEDRDALYEFLQEHGNHSLEFYEKFVDLCDEYSGEIAQMVKRVHEINTGTHSPILEAVMADRRKDCAVRAYIECVGIDYLNEFEEAYYGYFSTVRDFVEDIMESHGVEIPSWLCIDYDATWNCTLRHDFIEKDGYYFRRI